MQSLKNVYRLGIKELWSLARDPTMLVLIIYTFTFWSTPPQLLSRTCCTWHP